MNSDPYLGIGATDIPISNSEIQTFKDCKRKWWLTYYRGLGLKSKTLVGPLPLGTRVHRALEIYYTTGEDIVDAYNTLFKEDADVFYASDSSGLEDVEKKFLSEGELGRIMVEGYVEWLNETLPDMEYEIIDLESSMSYPVLNGRVNLIGKTDIRLLDKRDDMVYIGDFKTAAQLKPYYDVSHMSEQLMLYSLLASLTGDKNVAGGVYIILRKVKRTASSKPPFYERFIIRFNDKSIESFYERVLAELSQMLDARDRLDSGESHKTVVYPSPSNDCVWKCPFFAVCPMFDDGSSAEGWLDKNTELVNPYERYNEEDVASQI